MALKCWNCKSFDLGSGFDLYQCFSCGAHMKMDGTPAVPTSALASDGTYDGPGKELIEDTEKPPFKAKEAIQ